MADPNSRAPTPEAWDRSVWPSPQEVRSWQEQRAREYACHMMAQMYDVPDEVRDLLLVPTSPTVH